MSQAAREDDASGASGLPFEPVPSSLDFPASEARILAFWKERNIFAQTLRAEQRRTGPSQGVFVFYEGPPTANGTPHNGHVLTRTMKDLIPRYKTMCGYDVPRLAGWDTHGLPVEVEVEKELGIHGKADIERYGIEPFIARCIESVFRYQGAWERMTEKIGFWVDMPSAYVTFHRSYVESVWWALSELHRKGLLYRGHKVCWWWPQGGTALSAAEVGWNYKSVDDPSAYIAFPLLDEPGVSLCVWTTTPWTLPSNGYAAVKADVDYALVDDGRGGQLIVAEALRELLAGKLGRKLTPLGRRRGAELVGKRYRPPFDTFARQLGERTVRLAGGAEVAMYWRVIAGDFVTLDTGTGIVHVAPAFGEDDFVAHRALLATYARPDDVPLICSVAPDGTFTEVMGAYAGRNIEDCDRELCAELERSGVLVHYETYRHDYPYCWRADEDPLIQLARPAWYIRTTARIGDAIANNQRIRWLPEHVQGGRFGDFLAHNVDWALSRERFWGTPLNVWVCERDERHELAPASVAEIERLSPGAFAHFHAARRADPGLSEHLIVHKPWIDRVLLSCPECGAAMRRVPEVIDAWFDSGCMPFAQFGFPASPGAKEKFDAAWPADFISEAIDQTRGWFYSLLMVSTLVFDEETLSRQGLRPRGWPHPYRSCVVLGHVCDREGKKESKSRGNFTPPDVILERVRLEFAAIAAGSQALGALKSKLGPAEGVAYIARADYEGLDLTGESAPIECYRQGREAARRRLELRPHKGLPRRVVVLAPGDRAALEVEPCAEGLEVAPQDVPRLPEAQRIWLEDPARPAPGADAFRWFFYAASPPWTSTRHSLTAVRLMQKDFIIKLRHVYSFFVIYANIDGFSPRGGSARPVLQRGLLDRWLASEVALASRELRRHLDRYETYEAAQRLIDLVDALSNWYVRRSRARFWAAAGDASARADKCDAYLTLYEALVTLSKLIAPFVPFFAEELHQNLVRRPLGEAAAESVHLCAYPTPDEAAIDEALSARMRRVRELVSLGLQVRSESKLKVRQPLARCDVVLPDRDATEDLAPYADLLAEELNVHELRWLLPGEEEHAVRYELRPNFRALGPRLGKHMKAVQAWLQQADGGRLRAELAATGRVSVPLGAQSVELAEGDVQAVVVAAEGFAAAGGKAGVVVLHTTLTPELCDEGLAREVLARVQAMRKELALEYTGRIELFVDGGERVRRVVEQARAHIVKEALCAELVVGPLPQGEASADARAELTEQDESVRLALRRVG